MKLIKPFKKIPGWYLVHAKPPINNAPLYNHVIQSITKSEFERNKDNCQSRQLKHGLYEISVEVKEIKDSFGYNEFRCIMPGDFHVAVENSVHKLLTSISEGHCELKNGILTCRGYFIKAGSEIKFRLMTDSDENYNNF